MVALSFEIHVHSNSTTTKWMISKFNFNYFTCSFCSRTRKRLPPISLIMSSSVQLPCAIKYSINCGYFETFSRPTGVLFEKDLLFREKSRLKTKTYLGIPSKSEPIPTQSILATFRTWLICAEREFQLINYKRKKNEREILYRLHRRYFQHSVDRIE